MAGADYRHCDICDAKAFYDAELHHDFYEYPDTGLAHLGEDAVICRDCARTHRTAVLPRLGPSGLAVVGDTLRAVGVPEAFVSALLAQKGGG
jgi:hypothetical protein